MHLEYLSFQTIKDFITITKITVQVHAYASLNIILLELHSSFH